MKLGDHSKADVVSIYSVPMPPIVGALLPGIHVAAMTSEAGQP